MFQVQNPFVRTNELPFGSTHEWVSFEQLIFESSLSFISPEARNILANGICKLPCSDRIYGSHNTTRYIVTATAVWFPGKVLTVAQCDTIQWIPQNNYGNKNRIFYTVDTKVAIPISFVRVCVCFYENYIVVNYEVSREIGSEVVRK